MMKIEGQGNIKSTSAPKRSARTSGAGGIFSDLLSGSVSDDVATSSANATAETAGISGLFTLQEIDGQEIERKKLIKHGEEVLDSLEKIRRGLLLGTISADTLHELSTQLAKRRGKFTDPKLTAILDDIELRAAVELAKLEMANENKKL